MYIITLSINRQLNHTKSNSYTQLFDETYNKYDKENYVQHC